MKWNTLRPANSTAELILQLLVALFLAILFLQSGIDKVADRSGNLSFVRGYFDKSPLKGLAPHLLTVLTVLELLAGILSGLGVLQLLFSGQSVLAYWGAVLAALSFLAIFFGQRMAKQYTDAGTLVPYFLLAVAALHVLR